MAYLTVSDVTTKLVGSPYSDEWLALTLAQQEYGIKQATRLLNKLMFEGKKVDFEQEDLFPRYVRGYTVQCPDDILQGLAIESMYQGANKSEDSVLAAAKGNIQEETIDEAKVVFNLKGKQGLEYLSLNMKSLEACKLIYPYVLKGGYY